MFPFVDADEIGARLQCPIELGFVVNFDQAVNSNLASHGLKPFQLIVGQGGDNQEHRVSTRECSLINLDFIDGEVLTQKGSGNFAPNQCEVIQVTLEELLI